MNLNWKHYFFRFTLSGTLAIAPFSLVAKDEEKKSDDSPASNGYTINYNTVSIVEYIRFASKICNQNFIFNEEDLPFTVTVVSDAPITPENVMSTLIQILRIHGMMLLEQGNSLVIHKSTSIRQPATLVLEDGKNGTNAPIVTRIFRLKNSNPSSVAAIVRPMISEDALIEVSSETRQLILTDVTASVDKVAVLIENLDSPHTPLEIRSFEAKFNTPDYLVGLVMQIMNPIAQGNPFILVPQDLANTLFIVSTPELNEKAIAVLTNLDIAPKKTVLAARKIKSENIFIVKLDHRSGDEVLKGLKELADKLQTSGVIESDLVESIDNAKWIHETNTILFVGSPESNTKIKEFISALDVPGSGDGIKTSFFVYKPLNRSASELEKSMEELADNLAKTKGIDDGVLATIRNMKVNLTTNTLLFGGDLSTFAKVKELLTSIDTPVPKSEVKPVAKSNFYIYKINTSSPDQIEESLKSFAKSLEKSNVDPSIVRTVESMKYIKESHSLLFTGPDDSLARIKEVIPQFDIGSAQAAIPASSQFFIYKPKVQKGDHLLLAIKEMDSNLKSSNLADPALIRSLESAKWVKNTNSILFTGDPASLQKVGELMANLDSSSGKVAIDKNFILYKPQYASQEKTEAYLKQISEQLNKKNDAELIEAIHSMKWIEPSQSFMFSGTQKSLDKIKDSLANFDVASAAEPTASATSFFIYPLKNASQEKTEEYLKQVADQLNKKSDGALIDTIQSMKWIDASHSFIFNGTQKSIDRLKEILATFDTPSASQPVAGFYIYPLKNVPQAQIESYLKQVADQLNKKTEADLISAIQSMKWIDSSHSFLFNGTQASLDRIKDLLVGVDVAPSMQPAPTGFTIYQLKYAPLDRTETYLKQVADRLNKKSDADLIETLHSMKWIEASHSFMFNGTQSSLDRVKELLANYDTPNAATPTQVPAGFYLYQLQHVTQTKTESYLKQVADQLNKKTDGDLIEAIRSMKWIEPSRSFMFNGTQSSLDRIKSMMTSFDVPANALMPSAPSGFYIYQLKYAPQAKTETYLKQVADQLNKKVDPDLIDAIRSMKWIEPSHSFLFNGTQNSLDRIKDLLTGFDVPSSAQPTTAVSGFFIYQLKFAPQTKTAQYLDQVADTLARKGGDPALIETLKSKKWIEESHSFMFSGSDAALTQVKELLAGFDNESESQKGPSKPGYFIYKLQTATAEDVEEDLDSLLKNLKSSGLKDSGLVYVLEHMRTVKETNSILLTGDQNSINEAKELIGKYDYARQAKPQNNGNFFMYKPLNASAPAIEKSLRDIGASLKKADLADPNLLSAIDSMKYVETTNSIIFTGTNDAIQKIQVLLKDIDTPTQKHAPIQHVGKTTFLLYKLKVANGPQITSSIKAIAADLKKSGTSDKEFVSALNSMKFIRETDSLMFTGTEEALIKVQTLVEKFDVTSLGTPPVVKAEPTGPSDFFIYKPQSLSGPELEKTLNDFAENLKMSGLNDPGLFNSIQSMKYIEKTQSLVFAGDQKSLTRVKELLKDFDIASNLPDGSPVGEQPIQSIDNISFLVYKLQFHKGDEIQTALRQIAKDLINSNAPINQTLLNSINSIQWLEVTNSLLCSGDQETLTRLRELIKSLDIPLKQVFIEVLVIETSLSNTLNFGLDWGGKLKYKNKFSGSFNNINPADQGGNSGSTTPGQTFTNNLSTITSTVTPTPQLIPFSTGFELGVIGDIIMHKGQSYLSLGSLVNALETDVESTVVMTPKIIAQDSKTATIFAGQNVPFAGSFISNSTNTTLTTSNIEYRDIGMNLSITPVLGNSDVITLDISLDNSSNITSSNGATFNFTGGSATGITTSRTTMATTVHVPNKHFLVLSGYVNNTSQKTTAGIPCLGGLPIIGAAFSESDNTQSNSNVVIFMRPTILDSLDDMKKLTSEQEDFFRFQAGSPYLEHNFDEAMELIKTPDDD